MSFFGGDQKQGSANAWGGFFKQAISSVENRFDNLLDQDVTGSSNKDNAESKDEESYTETYVDPISGMVTTVQRKRPKASSTSTETKQIDSTKAADALKVETKSKTANNQPVSRSGSDLSARLAAVMSEKGSRSSSPSPSGRSTPKPKAKGESQQTPPVETTASQREEKKQEEDKEGEAELSTQLNQEDESSLKDAQQINSVVDSESKALDTTNAVSSVEAPTEPVNSDSIQEKAEESPAPAVKGDDGTEDITMVQEEADKEDQNGIGEAQQIEEISEARQSLDTASVKEKDSSIPPASEKVEAPQTKEAEETKAEHTSNNLPDHENESVTEPSAKTLPSKPDTTSSTDDSEKWNAIIHQREEQVLTVMKSNAELHEQLQQLHETSDMEITSLKAKIDDLMSSKSGNKQVDDLRSQLTAKDTQIQGLMAEGEALSKRELKHMNALKKLRAEKQESEKSIQDLQKKVEKGSSDLVEANAKIARMTESEKKANESVKNATAAASKHQKMTAKLEKSLEETKNELKESQTQVEQLQKELEEMKTSEEKESNAAHAAVLEKELKANDRLHKELTETRAAAEETERKLKKNIRELQVAIQTIEEKAGYREDNLRQDIATLQKRLQTAEANFDEVHASIDDSTQPLLRQIEVLQAKINELMKSRDEIERRFIAQLEEAKSSLAQSVANEAQLEKSVTDYSERSQTLQMQVHDLQRRLDVSEANLSAQKSSYEETVKKLSNLENDLKMIDEQHSRSLEDERRRFEQTLKQRIEEAKEKWEENSRQERLRAASISSPLGRNKRQNSFVANWVNDSADESRGNRFAYEQSSPVTSNRSSFDSSPHIGPVSSSTGPPTIVIERLNATIRQLEGQNQLYQLQAQQSAQSRDELAEELVKLTHDVDRLREETSTAEKLKEEHEQLNQRYHAALEMLGERTEQVEELRADIADVKEMYRSQIVELVQKIDLLSKS